MACEGQAKGTQVNASVEITLKVDKERTRRESQKLERDNIHTSGGDGRHPLK